MSEAEEVISNHLGPSGGRLVSWASSVIASHPTQAVLFFWAASVVSLVGVRTAVRAKPVQLRVKWCASLKKYPPAYNCYPDDDQRQNTQTFLYYPVSAGGRGGLRIQQAFKQPKVVWGAAFRWVPRLGTRHGR